MSYFMSTSSLGESNMAASAKATNPTVSFLPYGALTVKSIVGKKETLHNIWPFLYIVPSHSALAEQQALPFWASVCVCVCGVA